MVALERVICAVRRPGRAALLSLHTSQVINLSHLASTCEPIFKVRLDRTLKIPLLALIQHSLHK